VAGLYKYMRNPQYVGVILVALSEAVLSGRAPLFGYAVFLAIGYHLFVRFQTLHFISPKTDVDFKHARDIFTKMKTIASGRIIHVR
jgi:hypothetical protein